jgi:glycosyltransferase involved in cell wall biosynthesis
VSDLREERWYAMDLVAEMLLLNLRMSGAHAVQASQVRPPMTRRLTRIPVLGAAAFAMTADRILNRVWDYPRRLRALLSDFDLFHIVDHSYAHLVTGLPPGRSVVTCHDIDAFRRVLNGGADGSIIERALGRRVLTGMRAAGKIISGSAATRSELLAANVVPPDRVVVVPYGVHPACSSRPHLAGDREAVALLGPANAEKTELLHVGSTIARKRVDALLKVVAALREKTPGVRLIQLGGSFTGSQRALIDRLGLTRNVVVLPFVEPIVLAAIYRRAALLLQTSEREGFGLPVPEALSCGTPVVASDVPALREVGGSATSYCTVGDIDQWCAVSSALLEERRTHPERWRHRQMDGLAWARRFDWRTHAHAMIEVYRELLSRATLDSATRMAS